MQEVEKEISAIDLNGKHIIKDCKAIIVFLRDKLTEMKVDIQSVPFSDNAEEIAFFKAHKPMLLGRLIYFHEILRIESQRPLGEDTLDEYYEKQQEEQKIFFDRHVSFFQYYRSGATYMDKFYFLRGNQESIVDIDVCHLDDDSEFSTGYDHLVARIMAMEMLYAFLSVRRTCLQNITEGVSPELLKIKSTYKWTGSAIELVEMVYALDEMKSINNEIKQIVAEARQKAYSAINSAMVEAYWQMGKRIVEEEQQGKERADYGKQLLKELSAELTKEFGKGFSTGSLYYYRQFYNTFPEIFATPWRILSWSHYKRLIQVSNPEARAWYLKEAQEQMWSYRTLDRNIGSQYYERLLLSHDKGKVETEMKSLTLPYQQDKLEFIKNPTVAEFIGLSPNTDFTESKLESAIIGNLQRFLLELGKGFSYVTRQKLVRTEKKDYYIDLVFYNYLLKCFVLIDLKTNPITHQDVGQMDMYVRMYDELMRSEGDNPTIGIVLCSETDEDIARYSVLHDNNQLFASKYMLYMPTEEELRNEIERQKAFYHLQHSEKGIE